MKLSLFGRLAIPLLVSVGSLPFALATNTFAQTASHAEAAGGPKVIFDPGSPGAAKQVGFNAHSEDDVTYDATKNGIDITVKANPKTSFPGIVITPVPAWNASGYGHIEMKVTNNGTKPIRPCLRIDNEGPWQDNRWSAQVVTIKPGTTGTVSAIFGYQFDKAGYPLNPAAIISATIFSGKSDVEQKYHVEQIQAAGPTGEKPYVDPGTVAVRPPGGVLLGGNAAPIDGAKQIVAKAGAKGVLGADGKSIGIEFNGGAQEASVLFKPASGIWNLNEQLQVRVRVKNTGSAPVTPTVRLESKGGMAPVVSAPAPVAPGAEEDIVVPFAPAVPCVIAPHPDEEGNTELKKEFGDFAPGTGTRYTSNSTTGVSFVQAKGAGAASYVVTGIVADMPKVETPAWLGQRPPVPGEWTKTFDEHFPGNAIDPHTWNIYTKDAWHLGANTHYSKDNLLVKDGELSLRVEKKRGHHNDNPDYPENDYQTGYADTKGKWTQRYGYFEARMKLPTAPNMFLAFWLMPDRGINAKGDRGSTKVGGMEFDIMETLSIWGPWRHDFGMHWDDYQKYHKSNGMFSSYCPPDKDGFITVGMLWTPGMLVNYDNGKEAARWESPRIGNVPEYIILDHITGGWESEPLDDKKLPADFIIDYIRVWQRKDLASPDDGKKANEGGTLAPGQTQAPYTVAK